LSYVFGKNLVLKSFPGLIVKFNKKLKANQDSLFYYFLFLRITPLLPNWFLNISSPILGVPYKYFFAATLFGKIMKWLLGLMPLNIIHLETGMLLEELKVIGGINFKVIGGLFCLGFVALLPTLFKKKLEKFDKVE
jgi:uncharacterized membrane protein YdjX (TVP38/TMEM64 family)